VSAHVVWLVCQNLTEILLGGEEIAAIECLLPLLEDLPGAGRLGGGPERHQGGQNQEAMASHEAVFQLHNLQCIRKKKAGDSFESHPPLSSEQNRV